MTDVTPAPQDEPQDPTVPAPAAPEAPADPVTADATGTADGTPDAQPSTDAAAEPEATDPTPDQVLPTGAPSDSREVAAMQQAGLPTPEGIPLDSYSREILTNLSEAVVEMRNWLDHIERQIRKASRIGS
jgi:hypothetical protein